MKEEEKEEEVEEEEEKEEKEEEIEELFIYVQRGPRRDRTLSCREKPLGKILSSLDFWFTYRKRWLLPNMTVKLLIWTLSHII